MKYVTRGLEYPDVQPVLEGISPTAQALLGRLLELRSGATVTSHELRWELQQQAPEANTHLMLNDPFYELVNAGYLVRLHRRYKGAHKDPKLFVAYSRPRDQVLMPDEDPNRPAVYWPERVIGRVKEASLG